MTKDEQLALLVPYFEKVGMISKVEYKKDPEAPISIRRIERLFKRYNRMQTRVQEAIAAKPKPAPKAKPKVVKKVASKKEKVDE